MKSGAAVADLVADSNPNSPVSESLFRQYESEMREHESAVHHMVDAFYLASRHTSVQKMITTLQGGWFSRKFVTFVGGDFKANSAFISRIHLYSRVVGSLFGNDSGRDAANDPKYLHCRPKESEITTSGSVADKTPVGEAVTGDSILQKSS